jgi:hypothetical protein
MLRGTMWTRARVGLGVLALAMVAAGCAPSRLETYEALRFDEASKVVETQENLEVLETLNAYKKALESLDLRTLEGLAADGYYENAGTTDTTSDDYGTTSLPGVLQRLGDALKSLSFDIVVKDMRVDGDRAWVVFEYVWNYRYEVEGTPRWEAGRDVNRMDLSRDRGGLWKISRGM